MSEEMSENANLFKPASWLAKVDFINHLILFNNVLMAVLAENRGGKSSFVSLMQSTINNQVRKGLIKAVPGCQIEVIQGEIADIFQLKYSPGQDLTSLITQANDRKTQLLLIVDDAHYLPDIWIEQALSALKAQGSQGYFHICLVGDFSIVPTLNQLARGQFANQIHTIELGALSEGETKVYIAQRLQQLQGHDLLINDQMLSLFYRQTAGDLAKINANLPCYLKEMLVFGKKGQSHRIRKTAITMAIMALTAGLSYQVLNQGGWLKPHSDLLVDLTIQQPVEPQIVAQKKGPDASFIPNWQEDSTVQIVTASSPFKKKEIRISEPDEEETFDAHLVVRDRVLFIPEIKHQAVREQATPKERLISEIAAFPGFPVKIDTELKPAPFVAETVRPRVIEKPLAKGQSEGREYTIQLLASHRISDLHSFVQKNKLQEKTHIYEVKYKDATWYVLTMGRYLDYSKARAEANTLPKTLAALNPWIRTTTPLQEVKTG